MTYQLKRNKVCIAEVTEVKKKGIESLFKEIMAENFSNLRRGVSIQVH